MQADRFEKHLCFLSQQAPPRVTAAVLSTGWNRWCTARRVQKRGSVLNICQLGCPGDAEDSLEHYARCPIVRDCHRIVLSIQEAWLLPCWLGTEGSNPGVCPIRAVVGAYATYRVTNMARSFGCISAEATRRAFRLAVTDATAGHGKTMATMRGKLRGLDDVEEEAPMPAPRRRRQR